MPNSHTSGEDVAAAVETLRQPEDAAKQEEGAVSPVLPTTPAPSPAPEDEPGLNAPATAEPNNTGEAGVATATTATAAADSQSAADEADADAGAGAAAAVPTPASSETEPSPVLPQTDEGPADEAADMLGAAADAAPVDTAAQAADVSLEASTIEETLQFTKEVRIVTVETTVATTIATTQAEAAPAAAPAATLKGLLRAACDRSAPSLFENFTPGDQMKRLARIGVATPSELISAIADGTLNESLKCKGPYWYTASQIHAIIGAAYPTTDLRRPLLWFGWDRRAIFARDTLQGILAKLRAMGVTTPGELATALAGDSPPLDAGKPMFRKIVAQALLAFLRQPGGVAPTLSAESAATQWAADPSDDGNDDVRAAAVPLVEDVEAESASTTAAAAAEVAAAEACDGTTAGDAAETADEFAATAATTLVTSPEEDRLEADDDDDGGGLAEDGRTFVVGGYVRRPPLLCPTTELVLREPHAGRLAASPQRLRPNDETPRAPLTAFAHFRSLEFAPADDNLFAPPVGPSVGAGGGAASPPPASRPARRRRTVQKPATATDLKAFAKSTMKQPALQVRNPTELPPAAVYDKTELPPVVPSLDQPAPLNPSAWAQYKSIDGQLGRGGGEALSPAKPSPVPEMRCVSPQRSPPLRPAELAYGAASSPPPDVSWEGTVESARRLCEINTAIAAEVEALRDVRSHSEFTEQSHGLAVRAHEMAVQQHRARSGASAALKSMSPARTAQPYADVAVAAVSPLGGRRPSSPLAPAHLERIFDRLETQLQAVEKQLDVEELTASTHDLQRQFTAAAASQVVVPRVAAGKAPDTFVI